MLIRSMYTPRTEDKGQEFDMPTLVVPDCAFSVQQLARDYAIGQLPPLSRYYYDELDDAEETRLTNELETDNYSDVRYSDKLDAMMQVSQSNITLKAVKDRIKQMREYNSRKDKERSESERQKPITAFE